MSDAKPRYAACEVRKEHYVKHWDTDLMHATGTAPGYCCFSIWCSCCASYQLRKRALYNDMTRYLCCAGYLPCSGRCGEQKCPEFCLATETFCCFAQSVASTRYLIQDQMQLENTKCDNCLIATAVILQYVSCIFSIVAMFVNNDGVRQAAHIIDCIADSIWCSVCACMQTQHKVQLDARDANPSLLMPPSPFMAPLMQEMGAPPMGPPQGYPASSGQAYPPPPPQQQHQQQQQMGSYPPQGAYPPPQPQGAYPPPQGAYPPPQPQGAYPPPQPQGAYPPPPTGYPAGYPPPSNKPY